MGGNGQNGVQHPSRKTTCAVCGAASTHGGWGNGGDLCDAHYESWRLAKESIRFNEHYEAGRSGAARVAFEDFVKRMRAEEANRAA